MIRIRFHGRGGHGVKTASRIVGTAGFLAGYECQDSPVYGAERRGAAVTAFTRIGQQPIRERGTIANPDVIVLADETLLQDPAAAVLSGQESASVLFINAESAATLAEQYQIQPPIVTFDVTQLTLDVLGRASALSAGLAAAAARLTGLITEELLLQAMREEFAHLGLSQEVIDKNAEICTTMFQALHAVEITASETAADNRLATVEYQEPLQSSPSVLNPGNAELRHTGSWRVERPVIDRSICTRCGLCFVECPDGAISLDAEGYPVIDYDHCKGCMICRHLCPLEAIEHKKETRAW